MADGFTLHSLKTLAHHHGKIKGGCDAGQISRESVNAVSDVRGKVQMSGAIPLNRLLLLIILPSLLHINCSGSGEGKYEFVQYVEAGVPVAVTKGGPRFAGDMFRFEKVVTLQQDPEFPESLIYHGMSFLRTEKGFFMGDGGRLYVNDSGNARIAVFDPSGAFERSIGGRGEGPGEFIINEMYELSEGVLKIFDHSLHRATFYRTDGSLEGMIRGTGRYLADRELFVRPVGPSHYDENGHLWSAAGFLTVTAANDSVGSAATREIRIAYEFPTPGRGKGGKSRPDLPFVERPSTRILPDGSIMMTDGVEPVLWWYWPDGSVRKRIDPGLSKVRVTRQDTRRFIQDLDSQIADADENERVFLEWMKAAVVFPEYRTLWSHISIDDVGNIWIEGFELDFERRDKGGGYTFYILSPEGEYLGTTRAPAAGRIMMGHLLGEVYDPETGREDYRVWRLIPAYEDFNYPRQRRIIR